MTAAAIRPPHAPATAPFHMLGDRCKRHARSVACRMAPDGTLHCQMSSLWRHSDFLKLWTGQTVSQLGSVVTRTALPLVALLALGAGPVEMAAVVVARSAGVLVVGLVAGVWVDRLRRRPLL